MRVMKPAAIPADDEARLAALLSYEVLDTPAEAVFDDLTRVAARICDTPIALVSLVDSDRQWFKSRFGLEAPQTPRDISFCGHVVASGERLEVNALKDERFVDNPLVTGPPDIRFYAGEPLRTLDGSILGTLCVIDRRERTLTDEQRDTLRVLSRQVVAQLELRRQVMASAALAKIAQSSSEPMCSVGRDGRVSAWNAAALEHLGWSREDVERDGFEILDVEGAISMGEIVRRACEGMETPAFETQLRTSGGALLEVEILASPTRGPTGEPAGAVVVMHDVTERKRAQRTQRDLVSTISHELRTPLTSIRGSLGLLLGGVQGEIIGPTRKLLEVADRNARRLVRLVSDFLDVEKLEAGMLALDVADFDAVDVFAEAAETARGFADGVGVRVVAPEPPATAATISVDRDAFMRIVDNLISNAVKHSASDQQVELSIEVMSASIRFGVHDRGPGIPAEFRPRVFEKFAQADHRDNSARSGTGLGLAISRGLAREMGGDVWFEDREGGGTSFVLVLPLAEADVAETA